MRAAFTAKTSIDRRHFGLKWNQVLETGGGMVGDSVDIEAEIDAQRVGEAAAMQVLPQGAVVAKIGIGGRP